MRYTCNRERLAEVAGLVGQAVPSKSTKRVYECLHLRAVKSEGALDLSGTDLEVAVRYRVRDVEVAEEGETVVPADLFTSLLREIGDETVSVSVARQKLSLDTDGGHFELECEDPAEYPKIEAFPAQSTGFISAEDLHALVRKTAFAAGKEAARFVLNGVKILVTEEMLRFVATDGRRLATLARPMERKEDRQPQSAIVSVKGLQQFDRIASASGGSLELSVRERSIALRGPDAEASVRLMEGTFPDHDQIVPKECKGIATVSAQGLISRLRQVGTFASHESQAVALHFRAGELSLSAAGTGGRAEVRLAIDYDGPEERVGFNPAFLIEALRVVEGETVTIGINNRNAAARVSDGAGFLYVLMPIIID